MTDLTGIGLVDDCELLYPRGSRRVARTLISEQLLHKLRLPVKQAAQASQRLHKQASVFLWQCVFFWVCLCIKRPEVWVSTLPHCSMHLTCLHLFLLPCRGGFKAGLLHTNKGNFRATHVAPRWGDARKGAQGGGAPVAWEVVMMQKMSH